jgi:hypothetical protein
MKQGRTGFIVTMVMMTFALLTGEVMAYSDAYFKVTGEMTFTAAGGGSVEGSQFTFSNNDVSFVSGVTVPHPVGADPLKFKYVSIVGELGNFVIGSQIGTSNIWNILPQTATLKVSSNEGSTGPGNTDYFTGEVKATTINLTDGQILWDLGSTVATFTNTTPASEILNILSNSDNDPHYTLLRNFTYNNVASISTLLTSGAAGSTSGGTYTGYATVVPEPGEWALIIVGFGLLGFSVYRKNHRLEFTGASNFRMS